MTVGTITPRVELSYTGPDDYDFSFPVLEEGFLEVQHRDTDGSITTLTISTDYTVSLNADTTGTVTITWDSPSGGPYTGDIILTRDIPIEQDIDWTNGGPLDMEQLEDAFDKLTMLVQQLDNTIDVGASAYNYKGSWSTGAFYSVNDLVKESKNLYICTEDHTAGTFATDLSAGKWELLIDITDIADDVGILDEDDFASDSAIKAPSQQSTKAYIAARVAISVETVTNADSPKTITTDDAGKLFRVDASGDAVTLVLPAEATAGDGWSCQVYSVDTTNTITVEDDSNTAQWEMDVAGQMIQPVTDGTSWYNARPGAILNRQLFTSGTTHNFKKGTKTGRVRGRGAGGSGASARSSNGTNNGIAGGGGQGGFFEAFLDLDGISSTTITIGSGGAAPDNGNNGNDGGNTQWADGTHTLTGNGGKKGISSNNHSNGNVAPGGDGGAASGGDRNVRGSPGEAGISAAEGVSSFPFAKSGHGGGEGGGSGRTGSGTGGTVNTGHDADANSGAGGSGALVVSFDSTGSNESGGAGADGYIHLEEMA